MQQIRAAAAAAGLEIGDRLRAIRGEHMFDRWRWGRVPMAEGGWLVTYLHDPIADWEVETKEEGEGRTGISLTGTGREVRHAVMTSQFGWGVYAVCAYSAGDRIGWYDGERITAEQWEGLGRHEGREHTIRTSWARAKTRNEQSYVNGIDGVAGMQYINTAYGREERERLTGRPEYGEKVRFKYNGGRVVVAVKGMGNTYGRGRSYVWHMTGLRLRGGALRKI